MTLSSNFENWQTRPDRRIEQPEQNARPEADNNRAGLNARWHPCVVRVGFQATQHRVLITPKGFLNVVYPTASGPPMSSTNADWAWLTDFCVARRRKLSESSAKSTDSKKDTITTVWRFCPSKDGEPWISYAIGSEFLQIKPDTLRKVVGKMDAEYRHPYIKGLFKLTGLETLNLSDVGAVDDGEET